MTTELPSALKRYRSELRDAIERDLDSKARHAQAHRLRLSDLPRGISAPGRWRGWAIVGTALAALALTGTFVFGGGTATVSAQTLAHRTIKALTTQGGDLIEYTNKTTTNSAGQVTMTHKQWIFGRSLRVETFGASGSPVVDASSVWTDGKFTGVVIDYTTQTWWPTTGAILRRQTPQVAAAIQQALQHGDLAIVGNAVIDGEQTIELSAVASSNEGSYDIWVDPTTYLPVQVTQTSSAGALQTEFEWLPATQSNLALLNPPIPSGFAQLPAPSSSEPDGS